MPERQFNSKTNKVRIGIYTASTQGFYFGELVNQIRLLCFIKDYELCIINTGDHGLFHTDLSIETLDAAIIIKNSISNSLAQQLTETHGLPCVAIGYDYFPIKIPIISTDNELGVKIALDHLFEQGLYDIAFVGDLSQYDIRKRYEAYCDIHDINQIPIKDEYLFNVDNAVFTGGSKAAKDFVERQCAASAVLIGAGLTGMGFYQQLSKLSPEIADNLQFICFDAISLIPVFTPNLRAIDPNIHLIAYRCLTQIDRLLKGESIAPLEKIEPKIIHVNNDPKVSYDEFLATCVDLPEFHNPNYMKAIVANMHDWPREIVDSNLDKIMSIAHLFEKYMTVCVISKFHTDSKNNQWIKVLKIITNDDIQIFKNSDKSTFFKAGHFSSNCIKACAPGNTDICTHFTINKNNKPWGFITALGNTKTSTPASSFFSFSGYMESIVSLYTIKISSPQNIQEKALTDDQNDDITLNNDAIILWEYIDGLTTWSTTALSLIGFESKIEVNIYQNMDITDRIHPDDTEKTKDFLTGLLDSEKPAEVTLRIKLKTGKYDDIKIYGEKEHPDNVTTPTIKVILGVREQHSNQDA